MPRIDRRLIAHFDWPLLLCVLVLLGAGLATVLSASHEPGRLASPLAMRQLLFAGIGLVALLAVLCFDYRWLERYGYVPYVVALGLLGLTAAVGATGGGARRWIPLGPFMLQPSEFAKVALVIALARHLHRQIGEGPLPLRALAVPLLLLAPMAGLILRQPDLGTALVIAAVALAVLLVAGMPLRLLVAVAAVLGPVLPYVWTHLKPYQQRRLLTFLDPQADPLGAGYHIIQSKIAIGSGQLHGKGFMQGTQNQLNFLPEQHTDFIFAVFAEEWGFIGAALLVAAYAVLLLRCFVVAARAREPFGVLLACGLCAAIFCQVIVNLGMAMGILPVVGVPLPFFSYGGSSLLASMIAVGLLMNISMRRFTF